MIIRNVLTLKKLTPIPTLPLKGREMDTFLSLQGGGRRGMGIKNQ
jgi:hypothetical protein